MFSNDKSHNREIPSFCTAQIVKDHELITLTDRDRQTFAEALLNPTPASKQAYADAQWYQRVMNKLER